MAIPMKQKTNSSTCFGSVDLLLALLSMFHPTILMLLKLLKRFFINKR